MERVLTNELLRYILVLGAGAVVIMTILARLITKLKGSFKPFQKSTFIYIILFALFFALVSLAGFPGIFNKNAGMLIFLQLYFLILGCFHLYFLKTKIKWSGEDGGFLPEMLFTLLICIFGCTFFLAIFHAVNKNGFEYLMACSSICFIVPFFYFQTYEKAITIPPKILKEWFYPIGEEIDEPEDSKMKNLMVISFEFQKQNGDKKVINFRAKAPRDMEFGQLFYYFINDYNLMNANSKIQFASEFGEAQGWIFYEKPRWFSFITKYIDPDKTVFSNSIKENDVIICTRSYTQK